MSLSIPQWQVEAEKMTSHQRADCIKAIKTLYHWHVFRDEYDATGLGTIQTILEIENEKIERKENDHV